MRANANKRRQTLAYYTPLYRGFLHPPLQSPYQLSRNYPHRAVNFERGKKALFCGRDTVCQKNSRRLWRSLRSKSSSVPAGVADFQAAVFLAGKRPNLGKDSISRCRKIGEPSSSSVEICRKTFPASSSFLSLGGILRGNVGEGNCESKTVARLRGDNFCRETSRCLAGPSGQGKDPPILKALWRVSSALGVNSATAVSNRRGKSIHQRCFQLGKLKCLNRQKRGLVYTKKLVFKGTYTPKRLQGVCGGPLCGVLLYRFWPPIKQYGVYSEMIVFPKERGQETVWTAKDYGGSKRLRIQVP